MTYADTSFIVSVYGRDVHTGAAQDYVRRHEPRLPFTFLHWPETVRSLLLNFPNGRQLWEEIEKDLQAGLKLRREVLEGQRVGQRAAGLLRGNLARWPALRSLDALHVAAAVESRAKTFLSFDSRSWQRVLASTQGLKVWPPLSAGENERLK